LIDIVVANQNLHLAAFSCSLALTDHRGAKRVPDRGLPDQKARGIT